MLEHVTEPVHNRTECLELGWMFHAFIASHRTKFRASSSAWMHAGCVAVTTFRRPQGLCNALPMATRRSNPKHSQTEPNADRAINQLLRDPSSRRQLVPLPDVQGIACMQKLYLDKFGIALSDAKAIEVLSRLMQIILVVNFPCLSTESMPENPTTIVR